MKKSRLEIILYVVICLLLSNICWYFAYKYKEEAIGIISMMFGSFIPMILALIFIKIFKGKYKDLGFRLNIKKSWKIYLMSFIISILLSYVTVPLMLLIFNTKVSLNFTQETLLMLVLTPIIGVISSIEMMGEEIGWIGYLYPKLEKTSGTILACIILGIIRGCYHFGIIIVRDFPIHGLIELTVSNILLSFVMVYMFKKSKSLFPVCLLHILINLFPIILVYENSWYYTSIYPMIISMLPAFLISVYVLNLLKKQNLIETKKLK